MKEDVPQGRVSDTLHVDTGGLVTLTTPNRQATVSVRAVPLPQGETQTQTQNQARTPTLTQSRADLTSGSVSGSELLVGSVVFIEMCKTS